MRLRAACVILLTACAAPKGPAQQSPTPPNNTPGVRAETVAKGLVHPWALEFLPDGRMLVTERPGRLRIVTMDGVLSEPASTPASAIIRGVFRRDRLMRVLVSNDDGVDAPGIRCVL